MLRNYAEVLQLIEKLLRQKWDNLFPEKPQPKRFIYIEKSGFRKRVVFIYDDKKREMLAIAHVVENLKVESRLRNHYNMLSTIHSSDDNYLKSTVADPLYFSAESGYLLLIQKAVKGRTLIRRVRNNIFLSRQKLEQCLKIAVEWLIRLNTSFVTDRVKIEQTKLSHLSLNNPLLKIMYNNLKGSEVPLILEHNDFSPRNLLYDGDKISVVDWEYSTLNGMPLWDLALFFIVCYKTTYSFISFLSPFSFIKHPQRRDLQKMFFKDRYYSGLIKKYVMLYCRNMGLSKEVGELLLFAKVADYMNSNNIQWNFEEYKLGSFLC